MNEAPPHRSIGQELKGGEGVIEDEIVSLNATNNIVEAASGRALLAITGADTGEVPGAE